MVGNTSAEYWNATGPSPSEYAMVKRYTNLNKINGDVPHMAIDELTRRPARFVRHDCRRPSVVTDRQLVGKYT